jgi:hypothetical protein
VALDTVAGIDALSALVVVAARHERPRRIACGGWGERLPARPGVIVVSPGG